MKTFIALTLALVAATTAGAAEPDLSKTQIGRAHV